MANNKIELQESEVTMATNSPDDERSKKRWGFISALPSEFLIHFRQGKLSERTCGQGRSCFKYPRDTVFVIPTSLKELVFEANQLTKDNVSVKIKGMAVYRITDPMSIYKLINWSIRVQAELKLAEMIGGMCRSTSKWLVSNMAVEECIRKRKEEIADALRTEVSQVVADPQKGWGVEIITIHINDVFINDEQIFEALQGIYKSEKLRESELAGLEMKKNLEIRRLEDERQLAELRKENEIRKARLEAEINEERIKLNTRNDERQFELDRFRIKQAEEMANFKLDQNIDREKRSVALLAEKTRTEAEAKAYADQQAIESISKRIAADNQSGQAAMERVFIEKALPDIAVAMSKNMANTNMTVFSAEGGSQLPYTVLVNEIMNLLRRLGGPKQPNDKK